MKNKFKILLLGVLLLSSSCLNETKKQVSKQRTTTEVKEVEPSGVDMGRFKNGTWKIDSVAENKIVIDRLTKDKVIQIMNFKEDGGFSTMEVSSGRTKEQQIGSWNVANDSVFILTQQGDTAMRYQFGFKSITLTLNGNFEIGSKNKKRTTFYLSKYVEPHNESIYGPKR